MITYKTLSCDFCSKAFNIRLTQYNYSIKTGQKNFCCSRACTISIKKPPVFISGICEWCNKDFTRKSNKNKETGRFCSVKCAASNTSFNRRSLLICKYCSQELKFPNKIVCSDCSQGMTIASRTLQSLREEYSISQYHAKIRGNSRRVYLNSGLPQECRVCQYKLHVDIAHIKDVKDFDNDTKLEVVNNITNLVALCKNHHWEFDNGHLQL